MNFWLLAIAFGVGLFIPTGVLDSDLTTLLITFFGLLSAGIIPAISLMVSGTLSPTLSVQRLDQLKTHLEVLVKKLLETLVYLILGAGFLFASTIGVPALPKCVSWFPDFTLPEWAVDAPERVVQAGVFVCLVVAVDRLRLVASAFKQVLQDRYEMARADSQKRISQNTAALGTAKDYFSKPEDFGQPVVLDLDDPGEDTT